MNNKKLIFTSLLTVIAIVILIVVFRLNESEKEIGYEVGIAFKKEKFTLLDSGHFFLSSNPEIPDKSWGADLPRATIWAKLKINTSNEIFYFFSTHLDTKSVIARREGSRINIEKIQKCT